MDRVLKELEESWHLKKFSHHHRGFFLSFDLKIDELAAVVMEEKYKKQKYEQLKKQALLKAKLKYEKF